MIALKNQHPVDSVTITSGVGLNTIDLAFGTLQLSTMFNPEIASNP